MELVDLGAHVTQNKLVLLYFEAGRILFLVVLEAERAQQLLV